MTHPLVVQLRFTRSEFQRAMDGVSAEDAVRRLEPMNCLSWIIGHLAWQEQRYWLTQQQGLTPAPEVNACANGQPASTPPLDEMWAAWRRVTEASDAWLDTLDSAMMASFVPKREAPHEVYKENIGTRIRRTTYHYWYHIGESQAIRQLLGHANVGQFVADMTERAPYVAE